MPYKNIKLNKNKTNSIVHIQLNRPKVLNALNFELMDELSRTLKALDNEKNTRAIVISGNEKAFAAGADIKEMADKGAMEMYRKDPFAIWDDIPKIKTPLIAAVSGHALGGGCELAMMCDIIVASVTAQFGQPEIKLGIIPGAGGTQRMTKALGKSKTMELILTGETIGAKEALQSGLVSKVCSVETYLEEALQLATKIATMPPIAVEMAKESILNSDNMLLKEGLKMERKDFYMLFDSKDQKEGMKAFIKKRNPKFKGE